MSLRRTLAVALTASVAFAGLVTVTTTTTSAASGAAPAAKLQPRVAVDDTTVWATIKTVPTGAINSVGIAVNGADDTVYVVSNTGVMSVINGTTGVLDDSFAIPTNPKAVAVDQNDDTIYTVTQDMVQSRPASSPDDSVSNVSIAGAYSVAVDSLDDTVYVSRSTSTSITYFSGRTPTTLRTKDVTDQSFGIAVDALDDSVWMSFPKNLTSDDSVRAWNGTTDALGPFIGGVGTLPMAVAVNGPDDTVYVADGNSPSPGRIGIINGRTSSLVSTLVIPFPVTQTFGLAVDDSTDRLFVATPGNKTFGIINGANTDDSVFLNTTTGGPTCPPGVAQCVSFFNLAVDDSGLNQGLVWGTDYAPKVVQALAQVRPVLQAPTSGAAGDSVAFSVTSTPSVPFELDDSTVWRVRFNGTTVVSSPTPGTGNTWSVPLPSGLPDGPVSVEVQFNGGQYAFAGQYTVIASTPTISSVSPSSGPTSGGTSVTIAGTNLSGATSATFGGTAGTITANTSTSVTVTTPAGAAGAVSVAVTTAGGTATSAGAFTYGSPAPPPPPPLYPPGPPTSVTAVAGDKEATVSWTPPTDVGASPIIEYEATSAPGYWSCRVSAPATSCTVPGLSNGASYTFTVRAKNSDGWGSESIASNAATPKPPSILITGSRDSADGRFVRVQGTTTDLSGRQVTPYVRFPGQTSFEAGTGTRIVDSNGAFTWQRKTGKRIYVYFQHAAVRSNTVSIAPR